jgi:hypothetical protein
MPELTRRRSPDAPDECWHVYFGDVRVGTDRDPGPPGLWSWACGHAPSYQGTSTAPNT